MSVVELLLLGVACYAIVGIVFAVAFVLRGVRAIDAVAAGAPWRVRALFAPGAAALWPALLVKWARAPKRAPA